MLLPPEVAITTLRHKIDQAVIAKWLVFGKNARALMIKALCFTRTHQLVIRH